MTRRFDPDLRAAAGRLGRETEGWLRAGDPGVIGAGFDRDGLIVLLERHDPRIGHVFVFEDHSVRYLAGRGEAGA